MAKLQKKWISLNAVDGTIIQLSNNEFIRARNAANDADVSMFKVNASDIIEAAVELDMGGNPISNVGTVDGVDVSTLKTDFDGHVDGGANKHDASEIDVESADGVNYTQSDLETVIGELDDALELRTKIADLSSLDAGKGASLVGVRDTAANFTSTDVEAVLAELQANINSSQAGINMKDSAVVASTADITISSAPASVDGVVLTNGDRVLLKDQTDLTENGVYDFNGSGSALTRSADFDGNPLGEVKGGNLVYVDQGTVNINTQFIIKGTSDIDVGTDDIEFTVFSRAEAIINGDGLDKTGLTLSVDSSDIVGAGLQEDGSNNIRIADSAAGNGIALSSGVLSVDFTEFDSDDVTEGSVNLFLTSAERAKLGFISVTQAVDLDSMESDLSSHLDGGANKHDDSEIDVETAGNYTSVDTLAVNLAALDTQIKTNADSISSSSSPAKEEITLVAQDIANGYVDLAATCTSAASISVTPVGGVLQSTSDFSVSLTGGSGGVTRVTFAGDLASELDDGDVLIITYSA